MRLAITFCKQKLNTKFHERNETVWPQYLNKTFPNKNGELKKHIVLQINFFIVIEHHYRPALFFFLSKFIGDAAIVSVVIAPNFFHFVTGFDAVYYKSPCRS